MDTTQNTRFLVPDGDSVPLHTLTQQLIRIVEMDLTQTHEARQAVKHATRALAELEAPFKAERKAIQDIVGKAMLASGVPRIRHDLFLLSAYTVPTWDHDKLATLVLTLPAVADCVSQRLQSRLTLTL
jgi:hypothetical protein